MLKRGFVIGIGFILLSGICGATARAQEAARAREVGKGPAEVTVTLNEQFFNSLLEVIFTRLKAPSFPLSIAGAGKEERLPSWAKLKEPGERLTAHGNSGPGACESVVRLEPEMDGVRTAVRFERGRVVAPLAFTGSYSVALIGCINFQGWADTVINLDFDRQRQVLSARVTVVDIHLSNIPSLASGAVVGLVQNAIDRRSSELGGVLTQAAIMAGLSDGRESNPVKRGAWLARRRSSPNRPLILRPMCRRLRKMTQAPHAPRSGSSSTAVIRPACNATRRSTRGAWRFEEFDAGGRLKQQPVDATSKLPDKTEVSGVNDLKRYLGRGSHRSGGLQRSEASGDLCDRPQPDVQ